MMTERFKGKSSKLRVDVEIPSKAEHYFACGLTGLRACRRSLFYFLVSLFFIFYFLLSTASADEISSRAAVVIDASTGKLLYAKNPDLKLAPASTTKLMTAIITVENADLKDVVTISRNASHVSPHKAGFRAGDRVSIEKLLYAALVGSANDAAVALAEGVAGSEARFVEMMNAKAASIGASNTRFINPHGLPGPGQYITASDLSKIMIYALKYPKVKEIIGTRVTEISTQNGHSIFLKNTDRLLWSDDELVGGKTGYTRKARHCFVCAAERQGDAVVVAVLGSPSRSDLWKESKTLIVKGFDLMESKGEPVVYVSKADDESPVMERVLHGKSAGHRVRISKSRNGNKVVRKAANHKKRKMFAKRKRKARVLAKHRPQKRNYNVAEKSGTGDSKG
jgi:D-alanyl-D-alanine carboxypeptidase (penicillin-binding protein 5/6)